MPISAGKVVPTLPEYQPVWAVQFLDNQKVWEAQNTLQERFPASIEDVPGEPGEYRISIDLPNQDGTVYLERGQLLVHDQTAMAVWIMYYGQDGLFTIAQFNLNPGPEGFRVV